MIKQNVTLKKKVMRVFGRVLTGYAMLTGFFRGKGWLFSRNSRELAAYKNKYRGRRVFLVGNGPSLDIHDLELLDGEIAFGCNMLFKMFGQTSWRPAYYCMSDLTYAKTIGEELERNDIPLFTSMTAYRKLKARPRETVYATNTGYVEKYYVHGNLLEYFVPSYGTVMSFMIELAMYMGFEDIYLLGVDCTNSFAAGGHFSDSYMDDKIKRVEEKKVREIGGKENSLMRYGDEMHRRSVYAYGKLEEYARMHGVNIWNATRGGELEVFRRVPLEKALNK